MNEPDEKQKTAESSRKNPVLIGLTANDISALIFFGLGYFACKAFSQEELKPESKKISYLKQN